MAVSIQEIQTQIIQHLQPISESAGLDAQVFLAYFLEKPRSWIIAHPEYLIKEELYRKLIPSLDRLYHGEPLPYVIGQWEFYGLEFTVTPDVLIPRPETELLVERAIHWLTLNPHLRRLIDVGTGSGCIGISIARHIPDVQLLMTDISSPALEVARKNLERYGLENQVGLRRSSIFSRVPRPSSFDLICANLPYIPSGIVDTLPVSQKEPRLALDGGTDGLKLIKRLLQGAKSMLDSGGLILLEIDPSQREQVIQVAQKHFPSAEIQIWKDLAGKDRCVEIETRFYIYHLCQREDWLNWQQTGSYRADSLATEGFIHCSRSSQIVDVANRYFQGVSGMALLTIDSQKLTSEIRWEKSGDQYYPHVYGPVNVEAVLSVQEFNPEHDGVYRLDAMKHIKTI